MQTAGSKSWGEERAERLALWQPAISKAVSDVIVTPRVEVTNHLISCEGRRKHDVRARRSATSPHPC
jgi:hypothetical protein